MLTATTTAEPQVACEWLKSIPRLAEIIRSGARFAVGNGQGAGALYSFSFSVSDDLGKDGELVQVGGAPNVANVPGELVRVYLHLPSHVVGIHLRPLRDEIEPFIEGVGQVLTHDTPEGFIVSLRDDG